MKKFLSLLIISFSLLLFLSGCTTTKPTQTYPQALEINGLEYDKLSYLLEGMIDLEHDQADTWNKPLSTDEQKGTFIFNILNNNYMDKYENPEEAPEDSYYPILESSLIPCEGDVHDCVFPIDETVKVSYKKSDIDKIMNDIIGSTLKDGKKIKQEGMILDGDKYLLFTYLYYGSDLIGVKGRMTMFEIDSINQISEKDIEVKAKYLDDALEEGENYNINECNMTYHISKNPKSFFGYTVNEYMYTGCKIDSNYIAPDFPSQIVYGIYEGVYSDYVTLKRDFETRDIKIDLNGDGVEEYFAIGPDSPNGTKILGIVGDQGYNFIYDFSNEIIDDYNDLLDGLFVEVYFEDLDGNGNKEVIVAIGDKKTWLEANIYKLGGGDGFEKIGTINGKSYLEYYEEDYTLHAPYSNNGVCKSYDLRSDKNFSL